jgi:hemolysin III
MKQESLGELIANAVSHGIGALCAISALIVMLIRADTLIETIAGAVFGIGLVFLYASSTMYHAFPSWMKRTRRVFRSLDHSAIFVLIVSTYTALVLLTTSTFKAYLLLGILWVLAITGIVMKAIWIKKFAVIHTIIYVVMGWSVIFIFGDVIDGLGQAFSYVLAGGIAYTLGVGFYAASFPYSHFVWHLFVMSGSLFHVISVIMMM